MFWLDSVRHCPTHRSFSLCVSSKNINVTIVYSFYFYEHIYFFLSLSLFCFFLLTKRISSWLLSGFTVFFFLDILILSNGAVVVSDMSKGKIAHMVRAEYVNDSLKCYSIQMHVCWIRVTTMHVWSIILKLEQKQLGKRENDCHWAVFRHLLKIDSSGRKSRFDWIIGNYRAT